MSVVEEPKVNFLGLFAATIDDENIVEFVANDDEYELDVELEKLRRRRLVFFIVTADVEVSSSSSVSSSVVLILFNKIFKRRLRGVDVLLLCTNEAAAFERTDVDDVSNERGLLPINNNNKRQVRKRK